MSAFSLTFEVPSILSAASAACTILENTVDDGPYPCAATQNNDGTWALTVTLTSVPAGLAPGSVQVQYGDWPLPQTDPTAFVAQGSPVPGTLSAPLTATLDWDVVLAGPFVEIAEGTAVLEAAATEPVYLGWTVTDALAGSPITLTGNSLVIAVQMAMTHTEPLEADWQAATLITRAAGTVTDGEYSELLVGLGQPLVLTAGIWRVYGRLTLAGETIVRRATGELSVQG